MRQIGLHRHLLPYNAWSTGPCGTSSIVDPFILTSNSLLPAKDDQDGPSTRDETRARPYATLQRLAERSRRELFATRGVEPSFNHADRCLQFNANANFEDVRTPVDVPVTGKFPNYVAGSLYRTGPGAYKIGSPGSKSGVFMVGHWFDGFTTTHKFEIQPGPDGHCNRVSYSSFMQVEKLMATAKETGGVGPGVTFGQRDPCDSLFRKVKSVFAPQGSRDPLVSNVGVVIRETLPAEAASIDEQKRAGRRLITISTDTITAKHIDADTLEPLSVTTQATLHPSLTGQMSAAHVSLRRIY